MYKIGEFSKITNLSVKTLRYYDEQDILKPSYRNQENDYRFYDEEDYKKAKLIHLLRKLDFSISELKDLLRNYESPSDLSYFLEEKKTKIELRIKEEKALIQQIDLYIKPTKMEDISMNYKIEIKTIDIITVASIRYQGKYSDVGKYIGTIYKEAKGKTKGAPFNCYYDNEFKEHADIELCVPLSKSFQGTNVTVKVLPKIKAICTTHIGDYETISNAYKALFDYANKNNLNCTLPSREIYIKGPGMIFRGNPNNYETEIMIPIEE